jgi:hypothetical protein
VIKLIRQASKPGFRSFSFKERIAAIFCNFKFNSNKQNSKRMNLLKSMLISGAIVLLSVPAMAQDKPLTPPTTPKKIKAYVNENFPGHKILNVEEERDYFKVKYEAKLEGHIKLEFDGKLNIREIESKSALPEKVIPKKVWQYVVKNHPDNNIIEWKRKHQIQEIELDNDLDLYFDLKGTFLRSDD